MSARRDGRKVKEKSAIEVLAVEFVAALAAELKDLYSFKENDIITTIFTQSYEGLEDASLKSEIANNAAKYYENFLEILTKSSIPKSKVRGNSKIVLGDGGIDVDKVGWSLNFCANKDFLGAITKALVEEYSSRANLHKIESEECINTILSKLAIISPSNVCHEAVGCLTSYCIIQIMKQSVNSSHFNIKNMLTFLNHDDIMNLFTTIGYLKYWHSKVADSSPKNVDFIVEIIEQISLTLKSIVYKKSKLSDNGVMVIVAKKMNMVVACILLFFAFVTDIKESNKSAANSCDKLLQLLLSYLADITSGITTPKLWETFILPTATVIDDRNMQQLLLLVELSIKKSVLSTIPLFLKWFLNDKNAQSILQLLLEQSVTNENGLNSDNTTPLDNNSDDLINDDPVEEIEFEIDTAATIIETLDTLMADSNMQEEEDEDNDLMVKEVNKGTLMADSNMQEEEDEDNDLMVKEVSKGTKSNKRKGDGGVAARKRTTKMKSK